MMSRCAVVVAAVLAVSCVRGYSWVSSGSTDGRVDRLVDASRTDGKESCSTSCVVDVQASTTTCSGPIVAEALQGGRARLRVDLTGCTRLEVNAVICDPKGYVLDIGDSPTNDGFGGDAGSSSNDAEVQIWDLALTAYADDYVPPAGDLLLTDDAFVPATGCVDRKLTISDGRLETLVPYHVMTSPYFFRLNHPDKEGKPDAVVYVGLNRVVAGGARTGSGLRSATFTLR
jgi:hypothetical protein